MSFKVFIHFCFFTIGSAFFILSWWIFQLVTELPEIDNLVDYKFELPTKIYDRNGELIDELFIEKRVLLEKENIPEQLKQAFIAIEDNDFYSHIGIDPKRIVKAFIVDLKSLSFAQGASTITQQTAKLFLLSSDRKIARKIKEILLAFQIEKSLEKDEILALYLNKAYMGNGAWGVGAASQVYFSKAIEELNLVEMAMLAGLVKAPSRLAPTNNIILATNRKNLVLRQMERLKFIDKEQLEKALAEPINLNLSGLENKNASAYFVEEVRKELKNTFGIKEAYKKGLSVYTTMDIHLQTLAQQSLKKGLLRIDKRHGYKGAIDSVLDDKGAIDNVKVRDIKLYNRYHQLERIFKGYVERITNEEMILQLGDIKGKIFLEETDWAIPWSNNQLVGKYNKLNSLLAVFRKGDVVLVRVGNQIEDTDFYHLELYQEPINNGGLIALDPRSGQILAMVGGHDFGTSQFNRAMQGKRQPGSSFKPIVYSAAIDNGYTTSTILEDTPLAFNNFSRKFTWFPKNYGGNFVGNISLRESLYKSKNVPTVKLGIDLGIENVINYARKFNIQSKLPEDPSISLGTASLSLLELTNAYSVFAAQGKQAKPYMIEKILDRDGKVIFEKQQEETTQIVSPSTAYIITDILQDVLTLGTAKSINEFEQPIAGKTGTTNNNTDAWFIGYTPNFISGVYVGNDRPAFSLGRLETGSRAAAPIWKDFMLEAIKFFPIEDFEKPENLQRVKIVRSSGLLDCNESGEGYYEYFKITTAPVECDINTPTENQQEELDSILQDKGLKKENFDL